MSETERWFCGLSEADQHFWRKAYVDANLDDFIAMLRRAMQCAKMDDEQLRYFAPMAHGRLERLELLRRQRRASETEGVTTLVSAAKGVLEVAESVGIDTAVDPVYAALRDAIAAA